MIFYAADYRRLARENLRGNWGLSIAVVFLATLLGGVLGGTSMSIEIPASVQKLVSSYFPGLEPLLMLYAAAMSSLNLAQIILGGTIALGNAQYHLDQYDRKPLALKTLFSKFHQFGAGLCLGLLLSLCYLLWFLIPAVIGSIICILLGLTDGLYYIVLVLFAVVPVLVASYRYTLAYYLLAEYPEMRARDAIRTSVTLMRGHKWELFCLHFSFLGWNLLAALTLGIGALFLAPYSSAANAAFYRQIKDPRQPALPDEKNTTYENT